MKKILGAILAMSVGFAAFADGISNNVGLGLAVPLTTISIDEEDFDDAKQTGFAFNAAYLGVLDNGIALKADILLGVGTSKDLGMDSDDAQAGFLAGFDIGAGYAFINDEKFTLAATGVFGIDFDVYKFTEDYMGVDVDIDYTVFDINLGADVTGIYRFTEKVGLYADLGFRWIPAGNVAVKAEADGFGTVVDDDYKINGKFTFLPAIGVALSF